MGNDLQSYRATIGLFGRVNFTKGSYFLNLFDFSHIFYLLKTVFKNHPSSKSICYYTNLIVLFSLLLLCGDVETNPGPPAPYSLISIVQLNVCGLKDKVDTIFANLNTYDIIALTETHLTDRIENREILLPGYNEPFRNDRGQAWGGVCVYVSQQLAARRIEQFEDAQLELIWIEILDNTNTLICVIYRPPNTPICKWTDIAGNIENVTISCTVKKNTSYKRLLWSYGNADWELFREQLITYTWEDTQENTDIDKYCETVTQNLLRAANIAIPNKIITIKSKDKSWITSELKYQIKVRDRLFKKSRRNKTIENIYKYKQQRNTVSKLIKEAKILHIEKTKERILNCKSGDKQWWKIAKLV